MPCVSYNIAERRLNILNKNLLNAYKRNTTNTMILALT